MSADHAAQPKPSHARKALVLKSPDGSRPQLLLAEDSEPVRVVTAAMLKGMGCDVDAVVHGEEAVKQASAKTFDVIVLDIEMPVMDGITAARSIRKLDCEGKRTPIMALSAFLADAMRQASWSDTFDSALPKPANRNELHAAVQAALDRGHHDDLEAEPVIAAERLAALKSGLARDVWSDLAAVAGRDIEDCVSRVKWHGGPIKRDALKLKDIGRTFAAPRLARVAAKLEAAEGAERERLLQLLEATAAVTIAALKAE
jgi:CheY-like chemotaxis protein